MSCQLSEIFTLCHFGSPHTATSSRSSDPSRCHPGPGSFYACPHAAPIQPDPRLCDALFREVPLGRSGRNCRQPVHNPVIGRTVDTRKEYQKDGTSSKSPKSDYSTNRPASARPGEGCPRLISQKNDFWGGTSVNDSAPRRLGPPGPANNRLSVAVDPRTYSLFG